MERQHFFNCYFYGSGWEKIGKFLHSQLVSDIHCARFSQMEEKLKLSSVHLKFFTLSFSVLFSATLLASSSLFWDHFFPLPHPYFCPSYPHVSILGQQQTLSWFCWVSKTNENFSVFSGKWIRPLPALGVKECTEHTLMSKTLTAASCPLCASLVLSVCLTQEVVWSWISHIHKNAK